MLGFGYHGMKQADGIRATSGTGFLGLYVNVPAIRGATSMFRRFLQDTSGNYALAIGLAGVATILVIHKAVSWLEGLILPQRQISLIRFVQDRRGNFAVGICIMLFPLIGAVGVAVDVTNINLEKSRLQLALDAASMEIAVKVNSGLTHSELQAYGDNLLKANLASLEVDTSDIPSLVYHGMATGQDGTQSLRTETRLPYRYLVPRLVGDHPTSTNILVQSRISSNSGDAACVYALNRTAPRAFEAAGSTAVSMDGCIIASNSSATDSIYVGGDASLEADCLQSSGGIVATSGLTTDCEQNRLNAWRLPDPWGNLKEPVPPILYPNPGKSDLNVRPGRYRNLDLNGDKTLEPGLYYVEGSLSVKGTVTGAGVTIFMADGGITVNGNGSLSLSAPSTGDYAGMLMMSARTNTASHLFNGNGATDLNGVLYFPYGALTYNGNNGSNSTCMRIVADTIKMSGNSNIKSDCSAELGGREARVAGPFYFSK
jgi:Flp pilus assembly protein TadG